MSALLHKILATPVVTLAVLLSIGESNAEERRRVEWSECLENWKKVFGTHCGVEDSIDVSATNTCTEAIDVRVCFNVKKKDGTWKWDCRSESDIKSGTSLSSGFWACHTSGKLFVAARQNGDTSKLPSPTESPEP